MGSLKIQVLGKGMIPRGLGLAPRKDPFPADYTLIGTILSTYGLKVNYVNPENGKLVELTNKNIREVWKKYSEYKAPVEPVVEEKPVEDTKPKDPDPEPKNDTAPVESVEPQVDNSNDADASNSTDAAPDETEQETGTITPVTSDGKPYTHGKKKNR